MEVIYLKRFSKDLDKINQTKDKRAILKIIEQVKKY